MRKLSFILACIALISSTGISLANTLGTVSTTESCSPEMFINFFPSSLVKQTLETYKVPKYNRQWILKDLASRDQEVIRLFEQKARLVKPKPLILDKQSLTNPENRKLILGLFESSLHDVFSQVLKKYAITDSKQIQNMFNDLQKQKADHFDSCVSSGKIQAPVGYSQGGLTPPQSSGTLSPK